MPEMAAAFQAQGEIFGLARRGNPNAAKLVAELAKLGVTINPDAEPAPIPV
jgi:hypothetical protein